MNRVPLGDVVEIAYGKALLQGVRNQDGDVPVYGSNGRVGSHSFELFSGPSIVIGRKGSVGAITFADAGGWVIDTAFYLTEKRPNQFDWRYMYHALGSAGLDRHTITTSIPGINRDAIRQQKIPLPSLPEQRRIADILDRADALKRKRQQALQLADDFLRATFLDMFGDPITNSKQLHTDELGGVSKVITGNTPPRENEDNYGDYLEWIKSDNITTEWPYLLRSKEMLSASGARIGRVAPKNSILVTCIAGSPESIGKAAIADRAVALNQQINAVVPGPRILTEFLFSQLRVAPELVRKGSTNSMKGMVSKGTLVQTRILVPPIELQLYFKSRWDVWVAYLQAAKVVTTETEVLLDSVQCNLIPNG